MKLLFNMHRNLVIFSLTLMRKVRVPDIQTWRILDITRLLRNAERLEK